MDDLYHVTFEGNRLDLVPGVDLYNHDFTRYPNRDIKMYKLARRSKSIITSSEFTDKDIPVWMDICSGTREDTERTIVEVKGLLVAQNGTLKAMQAGIEVSYIATLNEFNIEWNGQHAYCQLVFIASDPVGQATTTDTIANLTGVTVQAASQTMTIEGSYIVEPIINVKINAVTGGTGGTINLYNARTNQGITITANFAVNDILTVNSSLYTVTKNGANLPYEGIFPTFPPGAQQIGYSDTFTTRNVDITATAEQQLV